MFCKYCGKQVADDAIICPHCGCQIGELKKNLNKSDTQDKTISLIAYVFSILTIVGVCIGAIFLLIFGVLFFFSCNGGRPYDGFRYVDHACVAAFVLILVAALGLLISLAWLIPMMLKIKKHYKEDLVLSTGFKVCTLIFCNFISGLLLLLEDK